MKVANLKVDLFLDSGAYSAWIRNETIDIDEYIQFIKDHEDFIEVYANLDVIEDAKATWKNQMIMEDAGLNPIPVFHYGEDDKWLKRILNRGYDYVGLGMVGQSNKNLIPWLDDIFSKYLTDKDGMPIVKVHGFAVTSLKLMLRYPFYSVDSTTWVQIGRMGLIFVPRFRNGKYIYDEQSWKIPVSSRNPNKNKDNKHIESMSPANRNAILDYIHSKGYKLGKSYFKMVDQSHQLAENEKWVGKKPKDKSEKRELEIIIEPGLCNKYELRDQINCQYFLDLEKSIPVWPQPFKLKQQK